MSGLARVTVVGAGLVGGSIAAACRAAGVGTVVLTDGSSEVCARAVALGLAHRVESDLATAVADAQLVVLAVPSHVVADVALVVASHASGDAILTDVASLKANLMVEVESRLRLEGYDPGQFVGGHPMAGSERSGPDAADARLFQGATCILTPTQATHADALRIVSGLWRSLGARVLTLAPDRHDELVALVSHLPQVVASALADVAGESVAEAGDVVLAVAGGGFRDTTRVAASDAHLWRGILAGNREAVLAALERFGARLADLQGALEAGDDDRLETVLARAGAARRRLVPKATDADLVDLVIALDDHPGTLAMATTALGEGGINVEDLAMRHASDGSRGALLIRVAVSEQDTALARLAHAGLVAHVDNPGSP